LSVFLTWAFPVCFFFFFFSGIRKDKHVHFIPINLQ